MNLLLILGRASRFDVVNGEILAGPARQWFDSVIDQVAPGLSYEVLYVTDYLAGKKPITTPTHVLACGEECLALATFAGMTNIDTARGVVHVAGTKSFRSSSVFHAFSQLFMSNQLIITLSKFMDLIPFLIKAIRLNACLFCYYFHKSRMRYSF